MVGEIEAYFQRLGFTENEVKLYLALAELGKASANQLSKTSQMPRTTAYSVLENLVGKGVVSVEQQPGVSYYLANSPRAILRLVENEKAEINKREIVANELAELIEPYFRSKNYSIPRIQFFEGRKNLDAMLYDYIDIWQKSIYSIDSTWWGYQDHSFVEQYMEWLEYSWTVFSEDERVCLFSNKSQIEDKLKGQVARRAIRPVPKQFDFSSTIWVLGEYIVLVMTRQQPHYAFQMKDAVFASNLRTIFQLLWHTRI